jgi:hypothetical protein
LTFEIVPFDEAAARQFDDLRRQKLRIGSRDLKIAAMALVNHALLFFCLPIDPISKQCQACESRTGWNDGTSGLGGGKLIASPFPSLGAKSDTQFLGVSLHPSIGPTEKMDV